MEKTKFNIRNKKKRKKNIKRGWNQITGTATIGLKLFTLSVSLLYLHSPLIFLWFSQKSPKCFDSHISTQKSIIKDLLIWTYMSYFIKIEITIVFRPFLFLYNQMIEYKNQINMLPKKRNQINISQNLKKKETLSSKPTHFLGWRSLIRIIKRQSAFSATSWCRWLYIAGNR